MLCSEAVDKSEYNLYKVLKNKVTVIRMLWETYQVQ